MTFAQLVVHLVNFALPALFLALWVPALGHWLMGSARLAWHWRACWHAVLGLSVLGLASASLEWGLQRRGQT